MTKRLTGFYARGHTGVPDEPGNSLRPKRGSIMGRGSSAKSPYGPTYGPPRRPRPEPTDLQKAIYDFCVNGGWLEEEVETTNPK